MDVGKGQMVQTLPPQGRILGLDWGGRRVGVAISDSAQRMVSVRQAVMGDENAQLAALRVMILADGVVGAVVGLPLNMDGSAGESAGKAAAWGAKLAKAAGVPVVLRDERLSSRAAEAAFFEQRQGRQTRASKRDSVGRTDSGAAGLILESYLRGLERG